MWRRKKRPHDPRLVEKGLIHYPRLIERGLIHPSFRMLVFIRMIKRDGLKKNWG